VLQVAQSKGWAQLWSIDFSYLVEMALAKAQRGREIIINCLKYIGVCKYPAILPGFFAGLSQSEIESL
jgi:hypothetical protein